MFIFSLNNFPLLFAVFHITNTKLSENSIIDIALSNTDCKCLDANYTIPETTTTTITPFFGNCTFQVFGIVVAYIGDGFCDDGANNLDCNFDGGDCCGPNVNTDYCTGSQICIYSKVSNKCSFLF